jgi:hypothetical protein
MPIIETPDELYNYFKTKPFYDLKLQEDIKKDLQRSDPGNEDWKLPWDSGINSLFNVLSALAKIDPEIGYA